MITLKKKSDKKTNIQIKTLDVIAKEWFDRVNGNSYFSARITVNFGTKQEKTYYLGYQYGYGEHYRYEAFQHLQEIGVLDDVEEREQCYSYYLRKGIIARHTKHEKCLKRDVISFGSPD